MKPRLFLLLSLIVLCSCASNMTKKLAEIENEIEINPEVALIELEDIAPKQFHNRQERARYALLKSIALDKLYIDIDNDSLINIAYDYYSNSRRYPSEKMLSLFYKGIVQKNACNYAAAIVLFEQSGQLAEKLEDRHYLGLIYRNTADIFSMTNNNSAATDYHRKAVEAFSQCDDTLYVKYAQYSLAVDLMEERKFDESRSILRDLLLYDNISLQAYSRLCYAQTFVEKKDSTSKALELYKNTPLEYYELLDYGCRSIAHLRCGQLDSANYWMKKGLSLAKSVEERVTLEFLQADIDSASRKQDQAFIHIKRAALVQDSLTRALLHQSLSIAQRDYYIHEVSIQNQKIVRQRIILILSSIITVLVFTIIIWFIKWRQRREEDSLRDAITKLEMEKRLSGKSVSALIGTLFLEKYANLDLHVVSSLEKEDYTISDFKTELVAVGKNEQAFAQLFELLNTNADDIINKLKKQVHSISGDNLKLIALFFANIPDEIIYYIMKSQSIGSLKTIRSRFRNLIQKSCCPDEKLFLQFLERQRGRK